VVNVITKSGTNQFHGDLFEFVRNGDFQRAKFLCRETGTRCGATSSAERSAPPIKKDKIFGFFRLSEHADPHRSVRSSISFVPTAAVLNGDFSTQESSTCQAMPRAIMDPATGQPFPNNIVPTSRYSPQALALAKYLPASNTPCGQVTYGIPNPSNETQYIGRADWLQSSRNTIFTRYFVMNFNNPPLFRWKERIDHQPGRTGSALSIRGGGR